MRVQYIRTFECLCNMQRFVGCLLKRPQFIIIASLTRRWIGCSRHCMNERTRVPLCGWVCVCVCACATCGNNVQSVINFIQNDPTIWLHVLWQHCSSRTYTTTPAQLPACVWVCVPAYLSVSILPFFPERIAAIAAAVMWQRTRSTLYAGGASR